MLPNWANICAPCCLIDLIYVHHVACTVLLGIPGTNVLYNGMLPKALRTVAQAACRTPVQLHRLLVKFASNSTRPLALFEVLPHKRPTSKGLVHRDHRLFFPRSGYFVRACGTHNSNNETKFEHRWTNNFIRIIDLFVSPLKILRLFRHFTVHAHVVEKSSWTFNLTRGTWPKPAVRSKKREEKREPAAVEGKTVELMISGFVFCSGLPALSFLLFLEQICSLKNRRASISKFSSAELSISTFSQPYSKAWTIRPAPLEFCGTFKRKLQRDASSVVQSANGLNKSVKWTFWMDKVGFRRTRRWKMGLDFPKPKYETIMSGTV